MVQQAWLNVSTKRHIRVGEWRWIQITAVQNQRFAKSHVPHCANVDCTSREQAKRSECTHWFQIVFIHQWHDCWPSSQSVSRLQDSGSSPNRHWPCQLCSFHSRRMRLAPAAICDTQWWIILFSHTTIYFLLFDLIYWKSVFCFLIVTALHLVTCCLLCYLLWIELFTFNKYILSYPRFN